MVDRHLAAHRAQAGSVAGQGAARSTTPGRGPGGVWWVAWRQHRVAVLVALLVMVIVAVAVMVFQLVLVHRLHAAGCTVLTDESQCNARLFGPVADVFDEGTWRMLRAALVGAPIVLGVFLGAPMFPREFEQRTDVFALTQSVGRLRWWAAKVSVAGAPLVVGLLGLGFLTQWCDATTWFTARNAFDDGTFQVRAILPAAFGLLALAIAVAAGIVVRSVVGSLVTGLIVAAGAVILIAFPLRSHLVPVTRDVTAITATPAMAMPTSVGPYAPGNWVRGSGLLDADGQPVGINSNICMDISISVSGNQQPTAQQMADYTKKLVQCQREHGITRQYVDYVPASMLWPLRGIVAGICALLAALFLAFGAFGLRTRAGSRS